MSGVPCALIRGGTSKGAYFLAADLFLQVGVDKPTVSDKQAGGNLLAGVAPFAVARGLVAVGRPVRIRMVNTGEIAVAESHGLEVVLGAVSVAATLLTEGAAGHRPDITGPRLLIEHPSGVMPVELELEPSGFPPVIRRSGVVRTARMLFDGTVFPRQEVS
jgi:2-methylaconitate cis-trans-isomerase PrpF